MIFHQTQSENSLRTYLYLEELICLSEITNLECQLKTTPEIEQIFDLSRFQITDIVPNYIPCDISDYVCMYEQDFKNMVGVEFISKDQIFRLDKLNYQDLNIRFSNPNYYESKYFTSDVAIYNHAKKTALDFHLSKGFIDQYGFVNDLFSKLPLLCLRSEFLEELMISDYQFPFSDCFYVCDQDVFSEFFSKHNLNAIDVKQYLLNYHKSFHELDLDLLILLIDKFTDLYGFPGDYLFGILCKRFFRAYSDWSPKILGNCNFCSVNNFILEDVYPKAYFDFTRKNFSCSRSDTMNLLRLNDCVNNSI